MVTLESRWKTKRTWNTKLYVMLALAGAACVAMVYVACSLPTWFHRLAALALPPPQNQNAAVEAPLEPDRAIVEQLDREFTAGGYSIVLPDEFHPDLLPQPADLPRGARFTGFRFRGPWAEAAQLHMVVIDYPSENDEDEAHFSISTRLQAALDRLFVRLTRNAAMVRFTHGTVEFGELDDMPFVRAGFSGNFRDEGSRTRVHRSGVALVTVETNRDVFFYSFWQEEAGRETYDLLETSLFTLRPVAPLR